MKSALIFLALLPFAYMQSANAQSVTLVTLGDSLTIGDGDETGQGGFPPRVLALLQTSYPGSTLSNQAISGLTSDDLINIELQPAVNILTAAPAGNRKIALLWIGSNDLFGLYNSTCDEYYPGDYPRCEQDDIARYQRNLETILSGLKTAGAEPYIALLDDQSKRQVMADAHLRLQVYSNITTEEVTRMSTQVTRYNQVIRNVAAVYQAGTVDFYNATLFSDSALLSSDGNHPNATGYDQIAQRWFTQVSGTPRSPVADIKANGADTALSLAAGQPLRVTVSLQADSLTPADWWAVRYSPTSGWAYFNLNSGWQPGLFSTYQGPLFNLPAFPVFNHTNLPPDSYQFYFGIDTVMNGQLDMGSVHYDSISVTISP